MEDVVLNYFYFCWMMLKNSLKLRESLKINKYNLLLIFVLKGSASY